MRAWCLNCIRLVYPYSVTVNEQNGRKMWNGKCPACDHAVNVIPRH